MAILDRDRKLLWSKSHNRCALCQQILSVAGTDLDRISIIGEEAHIVARSPNGPRYTPIALNYVDTYDNLILLCRNHHKIVDDQPNQYTADRLRVIKDLHENRVEDRQDFRDSEENYRKFPSLKSKSQIGPSYHLMNTGSEVWNVMANCQLYGLMSLEENDSSIEQQDLADAFLSTAKDCGEISDEIQDSGFEAVRSVQRDLTASIKKLKTVGVLVYGRRRKTKLSSGSGPDQVWMEGDLMLLLRKNLFKKSSETPTSDPEILRQIDGFLVAEDHPNPAIPEEA
ncbi:MAG: HNH endonuclease signature motif containing protein [Thermomicrobiales bacterium]